MDDDYDDVAFLALATDPDNPVDIPTAWAGAAHDAPARISVAGVWAALIAVLVAVWLFW
jgi:hypothetical protein